MSIQDDIGEGYGCILIAIAIAIIACGCALAGWIADWSTCEALDAVNRGH